MPFYFKIVMVSKEIDINNWGNMSQISRKSGHSSTLSVDVHLHHSEGIVWVHDAIN